MHQSAIDRQFEARLQKSLVWFRYFIIATVSILFIRLFSLQIVKRGELYKLSEANRIQLFFDPAPRGIIYDRNGKVIVENMGSFSVLFSPTNLTREQTEETLKKLSEILNLNYYSMSTKVRSSIRQPLSILLAENVPRPQVFCLAEEKVNLPGVNIAVEPRRYYLHRNFASHLLGHLGEIGPKELEALFGAGYKLGDIIGKSGVEKIYDNSLRGMSGGRQIEIDANGRQLRIINSVLPEEGNSLILTLDERIQRLCEDALEGKSGAICAINPANGEVLALVSKPDFDPNLFTERLTPTLTQQLFTDPGLPMFDRAIQSQYAPGSLFKIVTAIAALEEGVITPDETMVGCRGSFRIGNRDFKCWKERGHGRLNIVQAIAQSCDIFFYQLGLRVGGDKIAKYAEMLGLGRTLGISLPSEAMGFVPDSTWKKIQFGEGWYPGDTANMSIGQGYLEVSPLQMASLISLIANGGVIYKPLIVGKIINGRGEIIETFQPKVIGKPEISSETLSIIRKGLREAVISGTSQVVKFKRLSVAGKTGTAQNPHGEDHAWFICYAPEEDPKIALAILVEHGGHGASGAAPLARQILNGVFTLRGEKEPEIFVLYED